MPWPTTSRHARGYGKDWTRLRQQAMTRDRRLCQPCLHAGRVTPATEVDHIVPKAKGGTDEMGNLQAICGPCHVEKGLRDEGKRVKQRISVEGWPEQD